MESIAIIWLIVIAMNFVVRLLKKGNRASSATQPHTGLNRPAYPVQTAQPGEMANRNPVIRSAADDSPKRFRARKAPDVSRETQYGHIHPERNGTMRFGGRPDLEPGYMYLNGVKVLIKEADRLEFLR